MIVESDDDDDPNVMEAPLCDCRACKELKDHQMHCLWCGCCYFGLSPDNYRKYDFDHTFEDGIGWFCPPCFQKVFADRKKLGSAVVSKPPEWFQQFSKSFENRLLDMDVKIDTIMDLLVTDVSHVTEKLDNFEEALGLAETSAENNFAKQMRVIKADLQSLKFKITTIQGPDTFAASPLRKRRKSDSAKADSPSDSQFATFPAQPHVPWSIPTKPLSMGGMPCIHSNLGHGLNLINEDKVAYTTLRLPDSDKKKNGEALKLLNSDAIRCY